MHSVFANFICMVHCPKGRNLDDSSYCSASIRWCMSPLPKTDCISHVQTN